MIWKWLEIKIYFGSIFYLNSIFDSFKELKSLLVDFEKGYIFENSILFE